jgi:hypothetical protein
MYTVDSYLSRGYTSKKLASGFSENQKDDTEYSSPRRNRHLEVLDWDYLVPIKKMELLDSFDVPEDWV